MSLLNPGLIETVYPKKEYQEHISKEKSSDRVTKYTLHFLIALNFKTATCADYAKKHAASLVKQDSKLHQLTPIMLAILLEKKELVEKLADVMKSEDFRFKDQFGFNALHLASVVLPSVVSLLIKKSDLNQLTPWGGTYENLQILAGHKPPAPSRCRIRVIVDADREMDGAALNGEELKSLTGLTVLREVPLYDSLEGKRVLWQQDVRSKDDQMFLQAFCKPKLDAYIKEPPQLTIKPSPRLGSLKSCLGVFVDQETAPFVKLTEYGGQFKDSAEFSFYVLGKFDGRDIGSFGTLANCGFPNAMFLSNYYEGAAHNDLFTIRQLKSGEEVLISYGRNYTPLVLGRQVLLGVKDLEKFFKSFDEKNQELKKLKYGKSTTPLESFDRRSKISALWHQAIFPLHYPNYLLHLWAAEIVPAKFWLKAMEDMSCPEIFKNSYMQEFNKEETQIQYICKILLELDALEKDDCVGYVSFFKKWVLDRIGIFTFMELSCAGLLTKKGLQTKYLNKGNFQNFFQSLPAASRAWVNENCTGKLLEFLKEDFKANPLQKE